MKRDLKRAGATPLFRLAAAQKVFGVAPARFVAKRDRWRAAVLIPPHRRTAPYAARRRYPIIFIFIRLHATQIAAETLNR